MSGRRIIHGRWRDGVWRYRLWSCAKGAYLTPEVDETRLRIVMLSGYLGDARGSGIAEQGIAKRLATVHELGTSDRNEPRGELTGPWRTEKCGVCSYTHHAFAPARQGQCMKCSEPAASVAHSDPCAQEAKPAAPGSVTEAGVDDLATLVSLMSELRSEARRYWQASQESLHSGIRAHLELVAISRRDQANALRSVLCAAGFTAVPPALTLE